MIDSAHDRLLMLTYFHRFRAAGMKPASRGRINRAGHFSLQDNPLFLLFRLWNRDSAEERSRIRVEWVRVQFCVFGYLYNLTKIHHRYTVRDMFDNAKIVGYEQIT